MTLFIGWAIKSPDLNKKSNSKRQKNHEINCWTNGIYINSKEIGALKLLLENFEENRNNGRKNNEGCIELSWNEGQIVNCKIETKENCDNSANLGEIADGVVADVEILSVLYNDVFNSTAGFVFLPESGSGLNIAIIGFISPKAKTIIPANACPFSAALSDHPSRLTKIRIMPIIVRMTRKKKLAEVARGCCCSTWEHHQ